ncbi:MAG: DNA polymerase Y family protein [Marinovum sp.]|nr:DNA polymerase Y family protein [Marinovum sp.]
MNQRRILSLWFPRLGAERVLRGLRTETDAATLPFAIVDRVGNTEQIQSLSPAASAAGIIKGLSLRDACAICPKLRTRRHNAHADAQFLKVLIRWAGKYSPWVSEDGQDALMLDITGCAHLFGGESGMVRDMVHEAHSFGLTLRAGLANSRGAAWALARFAGQQAHADRSGDAIDVEAHATRSRAAKRRHWERGGTAPSKSTQVTYAGEIAAVGQTRTALYPLPVAALRLDGDTLTTLNRLGLRRIGDLIGQPRATLARRFGQGLTLRLDQALGVSPEPVSPAAPEETLSLRLTLPDPIGLVEDVTAALDRLLEPLCAKLERKGLAARTLIFEAHRADHTMQRLEVRMARPANTVHRLRGLLVMKLDDLDAGFGIDMVRLLATQVEPVQTRTPVGHVGAGRDVAKRLAANTALDDLIGRLGARLGIEAITRRHPSESHLPEKAAMTLTAAFSGPAESWPKPARPRPLRLWRPEPVDAPQAPTPPAQFRWRRRELTLAEARGPERIAPEWWLDEPEWRSGQRDYWEVITKDGDRLWLFYAHGGAMSAGWFCHGAFA